MAGASAKQMWQLVLAINGASVLYGISVIARSNIFHGLGGTIAGSIILLLALLIPVIVLAGIYNVERWVTFIMWLGIIGSALTFNILNLAINIVLLVLYTKVLRVIYPNTPAPVTQ